MKKSPLRYPGGKFRAVKHILPYFPENIKEICSPFFGGGHIELALANKGVKVHGYDKFSLLVDFWKSLIDNKDSLYLVVNELHSEMSKEKFKELQKSARGFLSPFQSRRGGIFYALNRSSFSGTILSGGYSPGHVRFSEKSVANIFNFDVKNFTVEYADFSDSLAKHPDTFLYCDPPYYIESTLYGNNGDLHEGFDHKGLADLLTKRTGWLLSYNNCPEILELYKGYEIVYPKWKYGMSKDKESKEILVISR